MRRREFITLLGGAAAVWPLAAQAQQAAMPVIGFLNGASREEWTPFSAAFRRGLNEAGYFEGQNVTIEYRWAESQYERLPALAADLVRRSVTVIAATTTPAVLAAKAATSTIPIVLYLGVDPVEFGLVASLSRPGGNMTGVWGIQAELIPKRIDVLHELVPKAVVVALLVNPTNRYTETETRLLQDAARSLGLQLHVLRASTVSDRRSLRNACPTPSRRPSRQRGPVLSQPARTTRRISSSACAACDLRMARVRTCWRSDVLRTKPFRWVSFGRRLHRENLERGQTCRPAGRAIHESGILD
jgi:ABC-type uncharacterized transport system substrate-binding protein